MLTVLAAAFRCLPSQSSNGQVDPEGRGIGDAKWFGNARDRRGHRKERANKHGSAAAAAARAPLDTGIPILPPQSPVILILRPLLITAD